MERKLRQIDARLGMQRHEQRQAVLEEVLRLGLAAERGVGEQSAEFRVRPHALGLKPGFAGVSLNQLYDQLEAEGTGEGGMPGVERPQRVAEEPE